MKKSFLSLSVIIGLSLAAGYNLSAGEKTLKGTGMCAKCELGIADSCQNVVQVTYEVEGEASNSFHKNICKATKDVAAAGKIREQDGKYILTASKIELGKKVAAADGETTIKGKGMCAKCELGKADSCQNVVQVNYLLEANQTAKQFHKNVCTSTKPVKATGTIAEKDGKLILTASKIELDN